MVDHDRQTEQDKAGQHANNSRRTPAEWEPALARWVAPDPKPD